MGIMKILLSQKAEHQELPAVLQCRRHWGPSGNYKQNTKAVQRKGKPDGLEAMARPSEWQWHWRLALKEGSHFDSNVEVSVLGNKWSLYLETMEIKLYLGKVTQAGWRGSDGWVGRKIRVVVLGTSHTSLRRSLCFDLCLEGRKIRWSSKRSKQQPLI